MELLHLCEFITSYIEHRCIEDAAEPIITDEKVTESSTTSTHKTSNSLKKKK